MDYLFYVERSAENLQFFLWYWDYIQRWSNLLPRQKALSPPWDPEQAAEPRSRFIKYSHKRARSLKMSKVLAIMEMDSERALSESPSPDPSRLPSPLSSPTSLSRASTSILSPSDAPKDWQPCTYTSHLFPPSQVPSSHPKSHLSSNKTSFPFPSHHPTLPRRDPPRHAALPPALGAAPAAPVAARPRVLPARRPAHDAPVGAAPGLPHRRGAPARPLARRLPPLGPPQRQPAPRPVPARAGRAALVSRPRRRRRLDPVRPERLPARGVRGAVVAGPDGARGRVARGVSGVALSGEEAGEALGGRGWCWWWWRW